MPCGVARAGSVRVPVWVEIVIVDCGCEEGPPRISVIVPANGSQRMTKCGANTAWEPPPEVLQRQSPAVAGASRQSSGMAERVASGAGWGMETGCGGDCCGGGGTQQGSMATAAAANRMVKARRRLFAFMRTVWDETRPATTPAPWAARPVRRMNRPPSPNPTKPARQRADQMLVDRGLAESRTRAQALILAGVVFAGDAKVEKAGQQLRADVALEVRGRDHPWVSRGGIKLAHAIEHFGLDPAGVVAMDVGSSTGGFTDVLLSKGARRVFAVDSGTNQLAWKLRQDPRVTVLEKTSARVLTPEMIDAPCDWVVCDASFIGLAKVLEVPLRLAAPQCRLVALIKPQFEVGRGEVGKGGVVRDPVLHERVCHEVRDGLVEGGWAIQGIVESPIRGPEGNIEFLVSASRGHGTGASDA
jgi:23S rRNA (cytidine1920-2'-O)/16S rRNA (cytidine1409-2'-O)-methyltransferase